MLMFKRVGVDPLPNFRRHPDARWDAFMSIPDPDALASFMIADPDGNTILVDQHV